MTAMMLMIQAISQNIALFCCALFAGGSIYISLIESPATAEGGTELASRYFLWVHPRPAIVQASFAVIAALAGILAGLAGGGLWWGVGGAVLGVCALIHLAVIIPDTRRLSQIDLAGDPESASRVLERLARVHAGLSLAGLGALFIFIMSV